MRNIFNFLYEPESDLLVVNMYTMSLGNQVRESGSIYQGTSGFKS